MARRVHFELMKAWKRHHGNVYLSQKQIASRLRVSTGSVKRGVRELKNLGIWIVVRTNHDRGYHRRNRYYLSIQMKILLTPCPFKNVPSKKENQDKGRINPIYGGRPHSKSQKRPFRAFPYRGEVSWGMEKAFKCGLDRRFAPLARAVVIKHGDDALAIAAQDVIDDALAVSRSERPIKCRGKILTWRLKKLLRGDGCRQFK